MDGDDDIGYIVYNIIIPLVISIVANYIYDRIRIGNHK